ncbi:acyl-CoA dehydrogenase [Streptomyces sp. BE230]|uniref:acyl-CoA dehydrogenase n=1 Tax=Streptomyces sp. BE230 TaxID=3002526 RepID=UPI002ED08A66|nr:acyl-CoA dehydrogenase [Streptomyces sp. BE230]
MSELAAELRTLIDGLVTEGAGACSTADEAMELWGRMCELGLHRIGVPEDRGGSGGSLDDLLVVVEALAARGAGVPIVEASVAEWVLSHAGPHDQRGGPAVVVLLDGPAGTILENVAWGRYARRLVVCAADAPTRVFDVDPQSAALGENLAGEPRDEVTVAGVGAAVLPGAPTYVAVRERLALLWSAAVTGAARGAYGLTRTYVAQREQFGAPLLSLPAVATGLARMRVSLAQAETALDLAREAVGSGTEVAASVAVARITTAATATEIARLSHQLHGAMGITREYPLHGLTRRLWAWRDAVATETQWSRELGSVAAAHGESGLWTRLTATPH